MVRSNVSSSFLPFRSQGAMVFWWICCGYRIGLLHFMSCVLFMPAQVHFLSLDIISWRFIYPPDEMGYVAGLLSGRGNISLVGLGAYWEQMWHWWHHSEMEWTLWAMSMLHAKIPRKIKGCLSWVRLVTALLKLAFSPHCPEKTLWVHWPNRECWNCDLCLHSALSLSQIKIFRSFLRLSWYFCLNDAVCRGCTVIGSWCNTCQPLEHKGDVRGNWRCSNNARKWEKWTAAS